MLDLLRSRDQRCVDSWRAFEVGRDFIALLQQSYRRFAFLALCFQVEAFEDGLHGFHMAFSFFKVGFDCLLELRTRCCLRHFWKGFHETALGVINVREFV